MPASPRDPLRPLRHRSPARPARRSPCRSSHSRRPIGLHLPRYRLLRHDGGVTIPERPTRRVAVLAPMRPELRAVVRAGTLIRRADEGGFSYTGTVGTWTVSAGLLGVGPSSARRATEQILT